MGRRSLGRQKPGDLIRADFLNGIAEAVEGLSGIQAGAGLTLAVRNGAPTVGLAEPKPVLARITGRGTGAIYSWHEVYPGSSPGSFPDGYQMGSTSVAYAIEQNGNTAVPIGTRVVLYPIGGGRYRFQLGSCSQNSMSGTKPPIPADVAGPTVLASAAIAGTQAAAAGAAEVSSLTPYTGTAISQPMPGL